jgi:hypothetical protein
LRIEPQHKEAIVYEVILIRILIDGIWRNGPVRSRRFRKNLKRFGDLVEEEPGLAFIKASLFLDYLGEILAEQFEVDIDFVYVAAGLKSTALNH